MMTLLTIFVSGVLLYAFQTNVKAQETLNFVEINADVPEKETVNNYTFPKDFLFGVSISAPQYEGAWNINDRGKSVWDHMIHTNPSLIRDQSNMDVSNDFYHKYKEDLRRAKCIGTQLFKFSISWSRILPNGFTSHVSRDGVAFYRNLLDEILANGMIPMVTLFQWDLPYDLQRMGGLTNPLFVDWFEQYARFVFATFGNKVKLWMTMNDPNFLCFAGSTTDIIPALNLSGIADYLCGHHVLLAHARVYHLYNREFRPSQNGEVGYALNLQWSTPQNVSLQEDINSCEDDHQWFIYWFLHPIFSSDGDYPSIMKERVANYSRLQGFPTSRLPSFTQEQIRQIRGSADFLGLNYFTHEILTAQSNEHKSAAVSFDNDIGAVGVGGFEFEDTPWIFAQVLQRINKDCGQPTIYITENGFPDSDLQDMAKVIYLQGHLAEVLNAIQNGVDIRGYLTWSLLDCFQWQYGYKLKFGLFQVDFDDPNLTRTPRWSSKYIERVYKTRRLIGPLDIITAVTANTSCNFVV